MRMLASSQYANRAKSTALTPTSSYRKPNGAGAATMSNASHGARIQSKASSDNADGGWILDFGSSVTNTEEQRRNIQREIQAIESAIQNIEGGIQTEQRASSHVTKEMKNSDIEMGDVAREARERCEAAAVLKARRLATEQTLRSDLVQPRSDSGESRGLGNGIPSQKCSVMQFLNLRSKDRDSMLLQLQDGALEDIKTRAAELKDEMAAMDKTASDEQLVEKLVQKQRELQALKNDLQDEQNRYYAMQQTIQQAQAKGGEFAQEISNKERVLTETKAKAAAEQTELRKKSEALADEIRGLKSKEAMEADVAVVNRERNHWALRLSKVEESLQKREVVKHERVEVREETAGLKKTEESHIECAQDSKAKFDLAQKSLEEAQAKMAEAETLKEENDRYDAEYHVKAAVEYTDLLKEKEELAKAVTEFSDGKEAETAKLHETKLQELKAIESLDIGLDEATTQKNEKSLEYQQLKKKAEEGRAAIQREIELSNVATDKVTSALEAELARLGEEKIQRKRKEQEGLEKSAFKKGAKERRLKILKQAAQKIKATNKEEQAILAREVVVEDLAKDDSVEVQVKKRQMSTKSVLECL